VKLPAKRGVAAVPRPGPVRAAFRILSLILFSASTPAPALADDLSTWDWEMIWTRVLSRHVNGAGQIDFSALQQDHGDLDRVVAFIAAVDPNSQPNRFPEFRSCLSYYINAYNALAMYGVLQTGRPESLGGLTKFMFFYLRKFNVGGMSISLYDLENTIIRPMGDERVHFALNCMVVSCPRLPPAAFNADALDRQLDVAARAFIAETRNVTVDRTERKVWLSSIFKFYTEDFLAHAPSLIAYLDRYRAETIPLDFKILFLDYDWSVNDSHRKGTKG
jgi:hypothetical protein